LNRGRKEELPILAQNGRAIVREEWRPPLKLVLPLLTSLRPLYCQDDDDDDDDAA